MSSCPVTLVDREYPSERFRSFLGGEPNKKGSKRRHVSVTSAAPFAKQKIERLVARKKKDEANSPKKLTVGEFHNGSQQNLLLGPS